MHTNPNEITIEAYNNRVPEWLSGTPQTYPTSHLPWVDDSLSLIPTGGTVLEIGSATPRDAEYMRKRGYTVQCSDATKNFVAYLKQRGEEALLLNAITDPIPNGYDMIFANAVVPHFTKVDFEQVLKKVHTALKPGGIFAFSTKQGEGETWITEKFDEPRYTRYWQIDELASLLQSCDFTIQFLKGDADGDVSNCKWIVAAIQVPIKNA